MMQTGQVIVTGATGFIGRRLCRALLANGHTVVAITRNPATTRETLGDAVRSVAWDDVATWQPLVADSDAVFHLAGEPVAGERWTPAYKDRVLRSRVETTRAIAQARPRVLVSASAVGYYGDRGNSVVTDDKDTGAGTDFLAQVCVAWEAEADVARKTGARVVTVRIGIVLGPDGGPLQAMLYPFANAENKGFSPFYAGQGGPLGSGRQWVPWVHVDDVVRLLIFAWERNLWGVLNATAPNPVTNAQLTAAIGRAIHRPAVLPVPGFALRAIVGEFAYALLYSQRVIPVVAQEQGFAFLYADVDSALQNVLAP